MAIENIADDVYKAACLEQRKKLEPYEFVIWLNDSRMKVLESVTRETPSKEFIEKCRLAIVYMMVANFVVSNKEWANGEANKGAVEASQ